MNNKNSKVIAMGNAIMDIIIKCDESVLRNNDLIKGSMTLIDEQMAIKLSQLNIAKVDCGGSAANTIYCMSQLSSNEFEFIGKVGNDDFGHDFIRKINSQNIKFYSHMDERSQTATSFIIVTPDGQRTMCTNLGCASNINEDDIIEDSFAHAQLLYLEGYLWDKPNAIRAIEKAIRFAKKYKLKIALSLSDSFCVKRHKLDFLRIINDDINILFCNEDEMLALSDKKYFDRNEVQFFFKKFDNLISVVTRGSKGSIVINNDIYNSCPPHIAKNITDTTGAGDIFAAGFLHKFLTDDSLVNSCDFGNKLASRIIQKYGARFNPSDILE